MSEDNKIDNVSEAELSAALMSEVNKLDGKTEAKPAPEAEAEAEPEATETKVEEAKGDDAEAEVEEEGNPYRKRIDRLLRKRDTLTESLAEKEKRIAELEAKLTSKVEEPEEDEALTTSKLLKVLDDRDQKSKSALEASKAIEEEFSKLTSKIPNANKRRAEILELAEKNPTLTFEAIDRILAPEDHIDPIEKNRQKAKRMEVSSRSRADLESERDLSKASTSDIEKHLRDMEKSGKLII